MPSPLHPYLGECVPQGVFPARRDGRLREFPRLLLFVSFLLCLICTSCGAVGSGTAPPPPVTVTVMPNSVQLFPGGNKQFNAVVENASNLAVSWLVNQMPSGNAAVGIITTDGYYTAPNSPGTVTVTAVLQDDSTKTGSAIVTVQSLSSIQGPLTLSPKLSSVTTSQSLQLNVLTAGVRNSDVSWAVDGIPNGSPSVGTISTIGVPSNSIDYSPPSATGSHLITAILKENTSAIGTATVEVTSFPGTLTWRNDNSRSGVNSLELALSPATVNSSTFGKLFSCPIDGYAYAQPLYVPNLPIPGKGMHNVIFVATEKDSVFAFEADANPCVQLWHTSLIPAGSQAIAFPNLSMTGTDIVPFVGITGTPVIGMSNSALYVVAATQTIATNPTYNHRLYALDLTQIPPPEIETGGVEIAPPAGKAPVFDSSAENQRPALLFDNGTVYIAFGSYGGKCVVETAGVVKMALCPYHGWLFGYDSATLKQTGVFIVTQPPAIQGGIWQSGGGPSADSNGNVFVATGAGPFVAVPNGVDFSDSILLFGSVEGLSKVADSFTPCEQQELETPGQDIGTSAPLLLPDSAGSASQPHLLIGSSENGSLYVVNRDHMGGFDGTCSSDAFPRVQKVPVGAGAILSTPLFWNNAVYVAPGNGNLMSFPLTAGILTSSPASQSREILGPQGATPVISSNGTNNAILWLIDSSGAHATPNTPAILRAFDPNNLSNEIYNSTMAAASRDTAGLAVKFTVPTVANGKVYVGTQTELDVYGLLQ
jgi:hypothetical protein